MAGHVVERLSDERAYQQRQWMLANLKAKYAATGASATAAGYILEHLPTSAPEQRRGNERTPA
jgi:hypothetical protein